MLNFTAIIFIILFTRWSVGAKLDELNELTKDSNLREGNPSLKLKDTPLRESYRHKHKHKSGTRHHELTKRLADVDTDIQIAQDPQCAVLYKNNAPVGILQPFEDSYKFLPIKGTPTFVDIEPLLLNSEPADDMFDSQEPNFERKRLNRATFSDENYPLVFTKFQLHNRKDLANRRLMSKREENKNLDEINLTADNKGSSLEVEGKLESLLDDMGLLNDDINEDVKRDTEEQDEDENLEMGTNKIDLLKEGKSEKRLRRDDDLDAEVNAALNGTDLSDYMKGNDTVGVDNGSTLMDLNNNYTKIRKKSIEDEDIKAFKTSGDADIESDCKMTNSEGSHKVEEYEKRVEREIRDRIKKIKDEVTKEINDIAADSKRQKRNTVTTLLDGENKDIDPNFHTEENKIHIRKKRSSVAKNEGEEFDNGDKTRVKMKKNGNHFITYGSRTKREVGGSQFDKDEEEEINDAEEVEENDNEINIHEKDDCYCNKNDNDCECLKNGDASSFDEEQTNEDDLPAGYSSKKSVQQSCSCDKGGNHCKCSNNNQNFDYYEDVNNVESKSIDKKSVKQSCSCDKNGRNCKCNQFLDSTGSMDDDYTDNVDDNEDEINLQKRSVKARKYADVKPFQNGEYFVDLQPDLYRLEPVNDPRNKRNNFNTLLQDGARQHLVAVKQRSMLPLSRYRRRIYKEESNAEPRKLTNMSGEDLFGALPQSFDGELARYKRVKRSKRRK